MVLFASFKMMLMAQPLPADIGDISELNGTAEIVRDKSYVADVDFAIQSNDEAITKDGRMAITFLDKSSYFSQCQPLYMILYASGIIFFTFFYTSITFNPNETADNLRKYGGFVPGIRPGESTAIYIDNILTKLTTIGALYLTLVCLMPEFLIANYPIPFYLGGTSILIVVVVAIDTVTQIQTRLMSSQYEQLIKKTKFGR